MTNFTKDKNLKHKPVKVFLSYCWANQDLSDTIENDLSKIGVSIIRDKNEIGYKDSLIRFMKKVRDTDFVIILLSNEYLQSINCMYEFFELIKEVNFEDRILPITINDIRFFKSADRLRFIEFWEEKKRKLEEDINKVNVLNAPSSLEELRFITQICLQLDINLSKLADMKHLTLEQMRKEGYVSLLEKIGYDNITYLVELLEISLINDLNKREIALDEYFLKYPANGYSLALRAELAKKRGNFEKAKLNYQKSIELEPTNQIALNNLGFLLDKKFNDYKSAKLYYEKAIEVDPDFVTAKLNLGPLLSDHYKDEDTPKRLYEEIISTDPTEERAYNNLANIYYRKGDHNTAKELFEKALSIKPNFYDALINYAGITHAFFKDKEKALLYYKKAKNAAYNEPSREVAQILINQIEMPKAKFLESLNPKTGRNVLCPCGSGNKFKKCHGNR